MARSSTSFKKGNKDWLKCSKIGRDAIFTDPQKMLEAAFEYFSFQNNNPLYKVEAKAVSQGMNMGSDIELISIPYTKAYTWAGLCVFLHVNTEYFRQFKKGQSCTPEFSRVIQQIDDIMFNQKFQGAASGFFKENLIARDLGIVDKVQQTNININSEPVNKEEMKSIAKDLEDEL